jgi:hypothetical protein
MISAFKLKVLEALHWSDTATLAWLHYVVRRRDPAYGWFTEGLDTADVKDAKRLLDELA